MPAETTWTTCPGCQTLCAGFDVPCHHCRLDLKWLSKHRQFSSASVDGLASWGVTVCIRANFPDADKPVEVRGAVGTDLEIAVGGNKHWSFQVEGPPFQLVVSDGDDIRTYTELPWEDSPQGFSFSARLVADRPGMTPSPLERHLPGDPVVLSSNKMTTLGRGGPGTAVDEMIPDKKLDSRHCGILRRGEGPDSSYWLVDFGTEEGTFVNHLGVTVTQLHGGDFIQLGSYAFILNELDNRLIKTRKIHGASVRLKDVGVADRLSKLEEPLEIHPGQFVAFVGASGAGKSTLMKTISGEALIDPGGEVQAGGFDFFADREPFRRQLGYVPQDIILHPDLGLKKLVEFAAEMRGKKVIDRGLTALGNLLAALRGKKTEVRGKNDDVKDLLLRLGIEKKRWGAVIKEVSGGQKKRVQIATSLVADPKLLLADEPGSGLDPGREKAILQLLRGLSFQGCTVIVVTHGLAHLGEFDRVVLLGREKGCGKVWFDGRPEELKQTIPSRNFLDLNLEKKPKKKTSVRPRSEETQERDRPSGRKPRWSGSLRRSGEQCLTLFTREFHRAWTRDLFKLERLVPQRLRFRLPEPAQEFLKEKSLPWWILPILFVPVFFGLAVSTAVPGRTQDLEMLGFLSILSSIWMGSSLSLLSIVGERDVFNYERLLYLRIPPYVLAKCLFLWLLSAAQTMMFFAVLYWIRSSAPNKMLLGDEKIIFYLLLIGWAAVGMGLLISALSGSSGSRSTVANFILPLVIITQIVFSAHIVGQGKAPLEVTYGEFHLHQCQGMPNCELPVQRRTRFTKGVKGPEWMCNDCRRFWHKASEPGQTEGQTREKLEGIVKRHIADKNSDGNLSDDEKKNSEQTFNEWKKARDDEIPHRWATGLSYLTLSRWGDIAMRSFAYDRLEEPEPGGTENVGNESGKPIEKEPTIREEFMYSTWESEAFRNLVCLILGFPFAAGCCLWLTSRTGHKPNLRPSEPSPKPEAENRAMTADDRTPKTTGTDNH